MTGQAEPEGGERAEVGGDSPFSSHRYVTRRPTDRDQGGDTGHGLPVAAVQDLLDGLPGSVIFLVPERDADGRVTDFRVSAASPDAVDIGARRGKDLVGRLVLETYPTVAGSPLWEGYLSALETGVRYEGDPFTYEEVLAGIPRLSRFAVRASACQGGLIVSWVRLDSGEREQRRLAVMQRLGNMGWADWDLVADTISWSDEVYTVFGRDRSLGPMTLEELPGHVLPDDLPALGEVVPKLLGEGRPIDHTFRITTPAGELRHVRIVAEAETDVRGDPVEVHGFFQDLTATKEAEDRLLESQEATLVQRGLLAAERELAARLQDALLPRTHQTLDLAGLTVDVAYQPVQEGLDVGGDWYSAVELPDGRALIVVGDVAGHGLGAVATMAQLRFSAKGMAITSTSLPDILARLNTLLLHTAEQNYGTASMIMATYDPTRSELTWVRAGHPPPLLIRDGEARYLVEATGVLLGATHRSRYESATLTLRSGDRLLIYTDGLIETPLEDLDTSFDRLARTVIDCTTAGTGLDGVLAALVDPHARRDDVCALYLTR
ncbi:SpoIIE family protein phosphatase [Streptomyces sp. NPDC097619]|uniref:PP2C family protein-serine/threonine phosphatase n=1 Tax=Streptomyces sp. NPDC097619 TaxID=3157228 RepID=UPI003317D9FC